MAACGRATTTRQSNVVKVEMNADFFDDDMAGLLLLVEVSVFPRAEVGTLNFFMASPRFACFRRRLVCLYALCPALGSLDQRRHFKMAAQTGINTNPRNGLWGQ